MKIDADNGPPEDIVMSSKKIENGKYWNAAWQIIDGCTPCSPGCDHCWSAAMTHRFDKADLTEYLGSFIDEAPYFTGKIITHPERLSIPLKRRKPTVYAVWNDLFHEEVPDTFIGRALSAAIGEHRHSFLVLTKRAKRMASLMSRFYAEAGEKELRRAINVWCGLTVCNQQEADEKIPAFLQVPGKKFLSIEPMLGPVDLQMLNYTEHRPAPSSTISHRSSTDVLTGQNVKYGEGWCIQNDWAAGKIDAVILGGETGPGARLMQIEWAISIVRQCRAAGVPVFVKQIHINGKASKDMSEWPEKLRVRELPWISGNHNCS